MKILSHFLAALIVVTTSSANGFQTGPPTNPPTGGTPMGDPPTGGTPTTGGGTPMPWIFTHPDDGMEAIGDISFIGTGPEDSIGTLSIYSYTNVTSGGVYANELQLEVSVIVDTDPGIDWVGPVYTHEGDGCAIVLPVLGAINIGLITMTGGTGIDLASLALTYGGDAVLFHILPE